MPSYPAVDSLRLNRLSGQLPFPSPIANGGSRPPQPKHLPAYAMALLLLLGCGRGFAQNSVDQGWPQGDQNQYDSGQRPFPDAGAAARQPLSAGQLEQLVAPIALYPDGLVAQVLGASTYPSQVMEADRWRQEQAYASADQIAYGADAQPWDPSVKALTAFPQVLTQMGRNLQWTTDLGNAYYNQPQDVLEAVQVMRRRAQAAGYLRSTPQENVSYNQGNIELAPPDPQVVYVPTYNPWAVYGEPVSPYPGFSLLGAIGDFLGSTGLRYGLGIAMSAFTQTPWGWLSWGLDWLGHALLFHDSAYYSNSNTVADWGFSHRGFHAYSGRGGFGFSGHDGFGRGSRDFARSWGGESWRRGGNSSGGWRSFGRASERHTENWGNRSSSGFQSFRNNRGSVAGFNNRSFSNRPFNNKGFDSRSGSRGEYRYALNQSRAGRSPSYRASAGNFPRSNYGGRSSGLFSRSSNKAPSSGHHLFGGGGSSHFHGGGGGHAPKGFGGGKSFGGGGHSHGGGGHSGGHGGGGKHHR